jgi:urease accessory protein
VQKWSKPMSAAVSVSEREALHGLQAIRAVGGLAVSARADGEISAIQSLHEYGGYRIKCPSPRAAVLEAVMINTGGGVAGGDRISIAASASPCSTLALTTATAERIYRATSAPTEIDVSLTVADDATLAWLPQSTIVYSGASVQRRIAAELTASARLLLAETTAYGRTASGEVMQAGRFNDQWRIKRDGRLVFADATRLSGDVDAALLRPAVAGGASITSLLVCVAPDVEQRRDQVRNALSAHALLSGVSAWNGLLTVRLLGDRLDHIANALRAAVAALNVVPLPAAWTH